MELNMDALKEIQTRFYNDFPAHEKEKLYKFATPSTIKPTKWSCKSTSTSIFTMFKGLYL
jgi:acetylornithine deacetylase